MRHSFIDKSLSIYSIIHIDITSAWCQPLSVGLSGGCTILSQLWKSLNENIFMTSQPITQIKCRAAQKTQQTGQTLSIPAQTSLRYFTANILGERAQTCTNTDLARLRYELSGAMTFSSDAGIHSTSPAVIKLIITVTTAIIIIEIIIISSRMLRRRAEGQQVRSGNNITHQIPRSERMSVRYQRHYLRN